MGLESVDEGHVYTGSSAGSVEGTRAKGRHTRITNDDRIGTQLPTRSDGHLGLQRGEMNDRLQRSDRAIGKSHRRTKVILHDAINKFSGTRG